MLMYLCSATSSTKQLANLTTASKVLPVILIGLSAEHTNRVVAETAYRINNHRKHDTLNNRNGNLLCGKYKIKKI